MKTIMTLTTNHAASSYGIPVLVDAQNNAYGPGDRLPAGEIARDFVLRVERGGGAVVTHDDGRAPECVEGIKDNSGDMMDLIGFSPFVKAFTGCEA